MPESSPFSSPRVFRALVVGAGGATGHEAAKCLIRDGWSVNGIDRRFPQHWEGLITNPTFKAIMAEATTYEVGGLTIRPELIVVATRSGNKVSAEQQVLCESLVIARLFPMLVPGGMMVWMAHRDGGSQIAEHVGVRCQILDAKGIENPALRREFHTLNSVDRLRDLSKRYRDVRLPAAPA